MAEVETYAFPALKGIQAGREYYVAMCPLRLLPRLFHFDDPALPSELRAQRVLNQARVPEIVRYVLDNRHDYVFSSITASVDGSVRFIATDQAGFGFLRIPASARVVLNDGQHRRAAIEEALKQSPELGDETISVVFYLDAGLRRSQQIFADLNKHAVHPSGSLGILYEFRDPLAALVRDLSEEVPVFKGLTEKERTVISRRSSKLFTLGGIYAATAALLGKRKYAKINEEERNTARRYWSELCRVIGEWDLAARRAVSIAELREKTVCVNNMMLHALGIAGRQLIREHPEDWHARLEPLRTVDWSRGSRMWEGRVVVRGKFSRSRQSLQLTAIKLRSILGLPLSSDEAWLV
jgi:DNA sulfur modification protein DndB